MIEYLLVLLVSFSSTFIITPWITKRLRGSGLLVKDMNKLGHPEVPEMGGLALVGGFIVGVLFAIGAQSFGGNSLNFDLTLVLAGLTVVLITAILGIIDDLLLISQKTKALLPMFAALPLVALKAGITSMTFPLIGTVELGLIYPFFIVPLAITGASNACNMLAGFNGLEAGLGLIMTGTIAVVSYHLGISESLVISLAMFGSLLAFLRFNWFPAKVLIGDVGTLSIGALVASSVIIGNIERVGVILIIPFFLELFLKAKSRFQAQSFCMIEGEKLICKKRKEVYGIGRLIMYYIGGVREKSLVLIILSVELVFAFIAIWSVV